MWVVFLSLSRQGMFGDCMSSVGRPLPHRSEQTAVNQQFWERLGLASGWLVFRWQPSLVCCEVWWASLVCTATPAKGMVASVINPPTAPPPLPHRHLMPPPPPPIPCTLLPPFPLGFLYCPDVVHRARYCVP